MSIWRVNDEPPEEFLRELYGEDEEEPSDASEFGDSGDENDEPEEEECPSLRLSRSPSPVAPPYSPLTSPSRRESRERSRSPLQGHLQPYSIPNVEIVVYDEEEEGAGGDDADDFLTPDAHALFGVRVRRSGDARVRGTGSGRGRGRRGVRGRGIRRRNLGGHQWEVGHPLTEIWTTDADVPPELASLARDVVRRRQGGRANDEEVFQDASDGSDSLLEGQNATFEWSPMNSFHGVEETFRPERTGSTRPFGSAYDAFRAYWDDNILSQIVAQTNQYATRIVSAPFQSQWYPTNIHEILCLFSFWMMLGIVRMPTIHSCFSTNPLLKTGVFKRIFTKNRYENLTRALHFIDSDPASNDRNPSITGAARSLDRLHRLRPIISHLNSKFQSNYVLGKDICIDESLTLWKGRLDIKQYIRSKASKFGIKTFELCESATGYLWSFIVYTGKKATPDIHHSSFVLKSTAIVKKLIGPLLHKGHRLFMDNWYNSPLLARFLKLNGTDCVGTLRPSRQDVPALVNKAPLRQGELIARHSGDVTVLAWQDKKRITMISTCHGASTALPRVDSRRSSRPVPHKPQVVLDYNKFMGGVDLKDQMLEPYLLERKRCTKWYMKLFKRLLNVSILNSRTLLQSSTQKHHDHLAFRLQLVDSILQNHLSQCPLSRRYSAPSHSTHPLPSRMPNNSHWPVRLERPENGSENTRNYRKHCAVCLREGRKTVRTAFRCELCDVPLCIENCFKAYHT